MNNMNSIKSLDIIKTEPIENLDFGTYSIVDNRTFVFTRDHKTVYIIQGSSSVKTDAEELKQTLSRVF